MTPLDAELRALRARAYGPDADIHTDPAALARLAELEAALRPATALPAAPPAPPEPAPSVAVPVGPAPPAGAVADEPAPAAPAESAGGDGQDVSRTMRPRRRRHIAVAWAVSVVVALVLGAVAASTTVRIVSRDVGAAQVATLDLVPAEAAAWPSFLGPQSDDARVSTDFFGLTVLSSASDAWMSDETDECVVIVATDQLGSESNSFSGPTFFGCGAGAFPPTAQFRVTANLPATLRARFPVGSSLQFVVDSDRVGVFSDAE